MRRRHTGLRVLLFTIAALALGGVIGLWSGDRAAPKQTGRGVTVALPPRLVSLPEPMRVPELELPTRSLAPSQPAWQRNAVAAAVPAGRKLIAIVIDDMGVDRARSERAAALHGPLTLAFLPYARGVASQIAAARARGHEILVHVPMEPLGLDDPGPDALRIGLDDAEIRRRVAEALDHAGPVVGINNHMGSRFTRDRAAMRAVLTELRARELLFLDSRTAPDSVGMALAREMDVPFAARDVFLDNDSAPGPVRSKLEELEAVASRRGYAVAIGHPHDGTIMALDAWLGDLSARGFALVPVSAIVRIQLEERKALARRSG